MRAYFDRNVWQDLYELRRGITAAEVERLRSAVRHGEVHIIVGMTTLEETLMIAQSRPLRALEEVLFTLDMVGQRKNVGRVRLVKEPGDLIDDDIRAYATDSPTPSRYVTHNLTPLFQVGSGNYRRSLDEFFHTHRQQKEAFYRSMQRLRQSLMSPESGRIELTPDARRGFDEYFKTHAVGFARDLADHAGVLPLIEARGVSGLLDLRSVRMAVGASLSLPYFQIIENRAPDVGDSRDVHHAICTSAADVFVTNDGLLTARLRGIPSAPVEIIDLPTLLSRLGGGEDKEKQHWKSARAAKRRGHDGGGFPAPGTQDLHGRVRAVREKGGRGNGCDRGAGESHHTDDHQGGRSGNLRRPGQIKG